MQPKTVYQLRQAINNAKKIFTWTVIGQTQEGTPIGGFIEVYKSHTLDILKQYKLPTTSWDTSVQCFYRFDEDTQFLYIEGFHAS
jgi:hypothetical protein